MTTPHPELILASASPRRLALLQQIGVRVKVKAAHIDESRQAGESGPGFVKRLAQEKALSVFNRQEQLPVLAADTVIVLEQTIYGKPKNTNDAKRILKALSGKTHTVTTGTAIVYKQKTAFAVVSTRVRFSELADRQIDAYCASGEPIGKAGAYAIQGLGAALVAEIRGSYSNVAGLPLYETSLLLRKANIDIWKTARHGE